MSIAVRAFRQCIAAALSLFVALCCVEKPSAAQEKIWKQNATIGAGVAIPEADMRPYMSSAFLMRVSYAYRFHRFLQAEAGLDAIFGAGVIGQQTDAPQFVRKICRSQRLGGPKGAWHVRIGGPGTPRDFERARFFYHLAAGQSHSYVQCNVGLLYRRGDGLPVIRKKPCGCSRRLRIDRRGKRGEIPL